MEDVNRVFDFRQLDEAIPTASVVLAKLKNSLAD
jgi:hypothetical protein